MNEGQDGDREQRINAILEINQRTRELGETVEGLGDLHPEVSMEELEEVRGKMTLLREQAHFWLAERNPQRFSYDLRNFQSWLLAFLGDRSPRNKA